ncbi:MAG: serine hydrolase [Saprospiraceae bacterium]|nr:serine hydrolase [Saprospiraceae bacterium]
MSSRRYFLNQSGALILGAGVLPSVTPFLETKKGMASATPESQGVSSEAILHYLQAANASGLEHHSFMLMRHGKVISEAYWNPFTPDHIHTLYSLSKSFTSTAIGMAVQEGRFKLTDKVISFFPEHLPVSVSDYQARLEIRHLLNMASGHTSDTMGPMRAAEGVSWVKTFFDRPLEKEPGTHFLYNTGASYMCSAILTKVTGAKMFDYLTPRLFKPLGITQADWEESPEGVNVAGYGLRVTTRDIIKFGQLYLNKGLWQGKQLINTAYVDEATTSHITSNPGDGDWSQGYGYQFWRCKPGFYRGDGAFGQFCIVMPQYDAVIAVNSESTDMQKQMTLLWDHILPGIKDGPLKKDKSVQEKVLQFSNNLTLNAKLGESTSPLVKELNNQTYQLKENPWGWHSIQINTSDQGGEIILNKSASAGAKIAIPFGWNAWISNSQRILNPFSGDYRSLVPSMVAATAGTEGNDVLKIRLKYTEGIHGDLLTLNRLSNTGIELTLLNSLAEKNPNTKETRNKLTGII